MTPHWTISTWIVPPDSSLAIVSPRWSPHTILTPDNISHDHSTSDRFPNPNICNYFLWELSGENFWNLSLKVFQPEKCIWGRREGVWVGWLQTYRLKNCSVFVTLKPYICHCLSPDCGYKPIVPPSSQWWHCNICCI